jgi:hypothetical protein
VSPLCGIAFDSSGELYVCEQQTIPNDFVAAYRSTASGHAKPDRIIGAMPPLTDASAIAVWDRYLYAATQSTGGHYPGSAVVLNKDIGRPQPRIETFAPGGPIDIKIGP